MSNYEQEESTHRPTQRKEVSRRQFLSYIFGGTTAFLALAPVLPMVRFAVDPLLKKKEKSDFVKVVEASKITTEPQEFNFKIHQIDGWYVSEPELVAWIAKDSEGKIFALSPICKHLGCTISWNAEGKNEYDCPCHGARYSVKGKNLSVSRVPLDQYAVQIENGFVYLGSIEPNSEA